MIFLFTILGNYKPLKLRLMPFVDNILSGSHYKKK